MAAPSSTCIGDLFEQLLSMGFAPEDCDDAVTFGVLGVEEAVEWLIKGKPNPNRGPTLQLRRATNSMFDSGGLNKNNAPSGASNIPVAPNAAPDDVVITSQIRNAEQQGHWDKFHEKERLILQAAAKVEREAKQKNKEAILEKIAFDKAERKRLEKVESSSSGVKTDDETVCPVPNVGSPASVKEESQFTVIQIRFPSGKVTKHKFHYNDLMQKVWDIVQESFPDTTGLSMLQPFPRHVFTAEDFLKTFAELRLVPSGSLVVAMQSPIVAAAVEHQLPTVEPTPSVVRPANAPTLVEIGGQSLPAQLVNDPAGRLPAAEAARRGFEARFQQRGLNNDPGDLPLPPPPALLADMHRVLNQAIGANHLWGEGNQLQNQQHIENVPQRAIIPNRLAAADAAVQRADIRLLPSENSPSQLACGFGSSPQVSRLLNLCIQQVVRSLMSQAGRNPCLNLPAGVAEKILAYMRKERLLSPKNLYSFLSCHLNNVVLDFYPYATNELLHALRLHVTIQHVSLASCSLINDSGLLKLKSLKHLISLNLRECHQITDGVFASIVEFRHLKSLNLEGTKVTDTGVCSYIQSGPTALTHLNLGRTFITNRSLEALSALVQLISLVVDDTQITQLACLRSLVNLESLSLRATSVQPEALLCLRELPRLNSLSIAELREMPGDLALQLIRDLDLKSLQLPSRLTTTDSGVSYVSHMQLSVLNLANYIHLTDYGLSNISQMTSLQTLLLSNTKITDAGLRSLQSLHNLDILYLDRTLITDEGTVAFAGMPLLKELSLASTSISKKCLISGNLNCCLMLVKLNLSFTRVSDKGLRCLRLPNLSLISVDGTKLRCPDAGQLLTEGCPKLRHVSAKNVQPRGIYDSHDED